MDGKDVHLIPGDRPSRWLEVPRLDWDLSVSADYAVRRDRYGTPTTLVLARHRETGEMRAWRDGIELRPIPEYIQHMRP